MEAVEFYINLYNFIEKNCIKNPGVLGCCINVLEKAIQNLHTRDVLVNKFSFVGLISKVLQHHPNENEKLLTLLQDMTYGFQIKWSEPYLEDLINNLVKTIDDDTSISSLALSVLINICHKNVSTIYLLLRKIQTQNFLNSIKHHGVLAYKLCIILQWNASKDLVQFINLSIKEIESAICDWNYPKLKHIVDFIIHADRPDLDMKEVLTPEITTKLFQVTILHSKNLYSGFYLDRKQDL